MPNHIQHIIVINSNIEFFLSIIKSNKSDFDFNNFVPRPDIIQLPDNIDGIPSHISNMAELVMIYQGWPVYDYRGERKTERNYINYGYQTKWNNLDFKLFERCCKAIMETGFSNWYPWSVVNWGTKWNAYKIIIEGNVIKLQTACSTPMKIWNKIAELKSDISLNIKYADEDYGANCGKINIENGEIEHNIVNEESFAYSVWENPESEKTKCPSDFNVDK